MVEMYVRLVREGRRVLEQTEGNLIPLVPERYREEVAAIVNAGA